MLTNVIRGLLEDKPFTPFTMSLTSRTTVRIAQADSASVNESGEIVRVTDMEGRQCIISIRHIVSISPDPPPDEPVVVK
jgi:hypothetical protein